MDSLDCMVPSAAAVGDCNLDRQRMESDFNSFREGCIILFERGFKG
jgi:hypothetical protein